MLRDNSFIREQSVCQFFTGSYFLEDNGEKNKKILILWCILFFPEGIARGIPRNSFGWDSEYMLIGDASLLIGGYP